MTFNEAQIQGYVLTEREYQVLINDVLKQYEKASKNMIKRLRNFYLKNLQGIAPEDYYNEAIKFNRLNKLIKSAAEEYRVAAIQAGKTQAQASALAMSNNYYRQLYAMQWTDEASELFTFLNKKAVELSVFGTENKWKELTKDQQAAWKALQPKAGSLSSTLAGNRTQDIKKIRQSLTRSMIQGDNFQSSARNIRKIIESSIAQAKTIARTEGIRNLSAGQYMTAQNLAADGVDIERQWDATLDTRTRQTHATADGQRENSQGFFIVGGATGPYPGNLSSDKESINCRCVVVSIIDGVSPTMRRARPPVKTPEGLERGETEIISYKWFPEWMKENNLKYNKSGAIIAA